MRKKGFTIIEILVYVGVLAIILAAVISLLIWAARSGTKIGVFRDTLDNARRALEVMTFETRAAKSVYSPTTTASQLSLETTQSLPEGEEITYIDFFLCGKKLCLKREGQTPLALTSENVEIESLTFSQVVTSELPSIKIDLSVSYKNPQARPDYEASVALSSTISLRSYQKE